MKQGRQNLCIFLIIFLTVISFPAAAQGVNTFTLTADGIGPVQLGAKALDLPESVPQLYASKVSDIFIDEEMPDEEDMPEFATWYFYDEDGEVVFTATQDSLGFISEITISSPNLLTAEGIHVGTPQQQVAAISGILKIEPGPWEDDPRDSYELNGITLWIDGVYIDDDHSEYQVGTIIISDPVFTSEGIGPVKYGAKAADLPESVPRLYANKVLGNGTDPQSKPTDWHFYDKDGNELFTAEQDDEGQICQVTITDTSICTAMGVHVGMPLNQVEYLSGIQMAKPDMIKGDIYCYDLDDITLNVVNPGNQNKVTSSSLVASMSIPGLANELVNDVSEQVLQFYTNSTSLEQMESHINEIRSIEGVEDAYSNGSTTMFVNIKKFGTVSFSFHPRRHSFKTENLNYATGGSVLADEDQFPYNDYKFAVAFQMENDQRFEDNRVFLWTMLDRMKKSGVKNISRFSPTLEFYNKEMYKHHLVLIDTHGCYDSKRTGLHWIATSEVYSIRKVKEGKSIKQYKKLLPQAFLYDKDKVSIGYVIENRADGKQYAVGYLEVSENFFLNSPHSFESKIPVVVFCTACQSLMGNHALGEAFISKGAELYMGYDESDNTSSFAGIEYFGRVFSGMPIDAAYESLDPTVLHHKANLEAVKSPFLFSNIYKYYFLIPKFEIINRGLVNHSKLTLTYQCKVPIHYLYVPSSISDYKYNSDLENIPLKYGFELCNNKNFTGKVIRRMTSVGQDVNSDGVQLLNCKYINNHSMITYVMDINVDIPNEFYNSSTEDFYVRPFIYDEKRQCYTYGYFTHVQRDQRYGTH